MVCGSFSDQNVAYSKIQYNIINVITIKYFIYILRPLAL